MVPTTRRVNKPCEFWYMSNMAGLDSSHESKRWWIDVRLDSAKSWAFRKGKVTFASLMPVRIETGHFFREDDMPMCRNAIIISERARHVFEEHCPGNCTFVEIEIANTPATITSRYFVLDCIPRLQCYDPTCSAPLDSPYFDHMMVDATKVAPGTGLFYMADGPSYILVRDRLKQAMERAKLIGVTFIRPRPWVDRGAP